MRRTSRFTVWAVYDNQEETVLPDTSSRERESVQRVADFLNSQPSGRRPALGGWL
jgi:hypothetical protein